MVIWDALKYTLVKPITAILVYGRAMETCKKELGVWRCVFVWEREILQISAWQWCVWSVWCHSCHCVFRSVMSWGNKLFRSLAARARRLRYLFPEGSGVKSVFEGCVGSSTMLVALQMERVLKLSVMKGREAQMIFSNARCRVLQ